MPKRVLSVNVVGAHILEPVISNLQQDLEITVEFPAEVLAEAEQAAHSVSFDHLPDRRDIPFVTIDPEGSRDLDQAVHIERESDGYLIRYAISALGLFITPGGALDEEVKNRGVTVYLPDRTIPLHPEVLSAGAASLLPNVDRPAYLWYHHLDARGELTHTWVELAQVRSRAQLSYPEVQTAFDGDSELSSEVPADMPALLAEVGQLREEIEIARGGVSLDLPEQRVEKYNGGYALAFRELTNIEVWNAQISLLTGMAAAQLMLNAKVGILRTLPPAQHRDINRLRAVAAFLGLNWPSEMDYPAFVRTLHPDDPAALSFLNEAVTLFRGAGYLALPLKEGAKEDPEVYRHNAIAAPYAHVTAPLRRLVDRYALEVCRCLCSGEEIPEWLRTELPHLPKIMGHTTRAASTLENKAMSAVETLTLTGRQGERFAGVVIDVKKKDGAGERGVIMLSEPAVEAVVVGEDLPVGKHVVVELTEIDPSQARVQFQVVG